MSLRLAWLALACFAPALVLACREAGVDGPAPEEKLEMASAAPGALGALAGGTDAAPPPPARPPRKTWHVPSDDEEEEAEPDDGDGGVVDGGLSAPAEPGGPEVPL